RPGASPPVSARTGMRGAFVVDDAPLAVPVAAEVASTASSHDEEAPMADDRSNVRSSMAQDAEGGGFLAYYEKAHRDPLNRWTHHAAHALGVIGVLGLFYNSMLGVIFALSVFPIVLGRTLPLREEHACLFRASVSKDRRSIGRAEGPG